MRDDNGLDENCGYGDGQKLVKEKALGSKIDQTGGYIGNSDEKKECQG